MEQKRKKKLLSFEVIEAAIDGDAEAINQILAYLKPYIIDQSQRKFINEFGGVQYVTDEHMQRRLETKLITKILDFKIRIE
ncbi:MAG: helix-turn-helix domain-containing protein [Hespellia sp.]|nr:helix-turn-helix domain-containing protein [Hespellia sp.]